MGSSMARSSLISSVRKQGSTLVVAVAGEVDLNNSPELRDALLGQINQHAPKSLVLNLGQVPYMDSSAVAVLVELLRRIGKGRLIVSDLQPRVKGLLEIARLDSIFKIVKTEQEAVVE